MNAQESRDFVRSKCIEANPDILKLKTGCRFNLRKGRQVAPYVWDSAWKEEDGLIKFVDQEDLYDEKWTVEIIGRPIQLADVLLALSRENLEIKYTPLPLNNVFVIHLVGGMPIYWNLIKSFDDQSDETVIKIAEMMR